MDYTKKKETNWYALPAEDHIIKSEDLLLRAPGNISGISVKTAEAGLNPQSPWDQAQWNGSIQERDPFGKSPNTAGAKLDAGKTRVDLVLGDFPLALRSVAEVGTFGANKYTDHGWLSVPNGQSRYADARMRHYLDRKAGETHAQDSGLLHLAHEAWNVLAELELYLKENK